MTTNIGNLEAHIGMNTRGLARDQARASGMFRNFGRRAQTSLGGITRSVGAMGAAMGGIVAVGGGGAVLISFLNSAAQVGAKFEQTMATVGGVMRATAVELDALTESARRMGETTEFTASQAGEALRFLGMAGFDVADAIAALPGTLDLATAGSLDLGRAADIATNALTAMGLEVSELGRVNDVLVGTATRTNTNINELAEAFQYAAPFAAAYGYSIEELSGFIGILANSGIKASMAGTSLRRAMVEANKIAKEFGMNSADLVDVVEALTEKGYSAAEIMDLFKDRAGAAAGTIARAVVETKDLQDTLTRTAGEAQILADTMRNTLVGQFKEFQSTIEGIKLDVFDKMKERLKDYVTSATRWLREHKDQIVETVDRISRAIGGVVSVITTIGGVVGQGLSLIDSYVKGLQSVWNTAEDSATRAADVFRTSVQDIAKDAIWAAMHMAELELAIESMQSAIAPDFTPWQKFIQFVKTWAGNLLGILRLVATGLGVFVASYARAYWQVVVDVFTSLVNIAKNVYEKLEKAGKAVMTVAKGDFAGAAALIQEAFTGNLFAGVGPDVDKYKKIWTDAIDAVKLELDALALNTASPADTLTEEWQFRQQERINAVLERMKALKAAGDILNLTGGIGDRTKTPPGDKGGPKAVADNSAKIAAQAMRVNAQAIQSYEDLLAAGTFTGKRLRQVWEDYKQARLKQIELEAKAFADAGANALQLVLFIQAEQAKLAEDMKDIMADQGDWLKDWVRDVAANMRHGFADVFFRGLSGDFEKFTDFLRAWARAAMDAINAEIASRAAASFVSGLDIGLGWLSGGGYTGEPVEGFIGPPTPPGMAAGGIVTKPTLAMIGEAGPEAVVPLSRMNDPAFLGKLQGRGAGGGNTYVTIQTPDPASFKQSAMQVATALSGAVRLANIRNA